MKNYFLLILFVIALNQAAFSQPSLSSSDDNAKEIIMSIDKVKELIKSNMNDYQKIEKFKDNTGSRYLFVKDNQIQLVTVSFTENDIIKNVEWYFSDGQLIYSEQVWSNISNEMINNEKFYVDNDHLITWIKQGEQVARNSKEYKTVQSDLVAYGYKLKEELKSISIGK